ncbi:MAG: hypothetical protein L3K00_01165 [Thermoplasmata archaeon]|nr:hypothetical protein [Thermoplasmata archaeon]
MSVLGVAVASDPSRSGGSQVANVVSGPEGVGVASTQLMLAEGSLAEGAGPAHGAAWHCSAPGSGGASATCNAAPPASSAPAPLASTPSWAKLTYPVPITRIGASMVYDAKDKYVLLFGGYNTSALGDTWKFSGGVWTHLSPGRAPSARYFAGMTYDVTDGYVLLFGGYSSTYLSDTWKFVTGVWTNLSLSTNPGGRYGAAMAYDAADGYVVLIGGVTSTGWAAPDTWTFAAGAWSNKSVLTPSPSPRTYASLDYDPADGYVVLFGGLNTTYGILGDTWTYAAGKWTLLSPSPTPPARAQAAMAYSALDGKLVLFGGVGTGVYYSDTWTFVAGTWTKIATAVHPSKRVEFAMADGTSTTNVLLFGGSGPVYYLNDTWTLHGLIWAKAIPRVPAAETGATMTYDEKDGYVLLFGGETSTGYSFFGTTWKFLHGIWTPLFPAVSPSARAFASMAYDQADGYVVLFGGMSRFGVALDDTWSFVGGVWTALPGDTSAGGVPGVSYPIGRFQSSMTYDAADGYLLLFGGTNTSYYSGVGYVGDTWSYSAGVWTNMTPTTPTATNTPSQRASTEMTYDSEDGYVLLFSGLQWNSISGYSSYADTWSFSAGVWTNLTSSMSASPPGVASGALVDDTYDGYPILWGGLTAGGAHITSSTWEFTGTGWVKLSPAAAAAAQSGFSMAFDPSDNEVVLLTVTGPTWTY